MAKILNPEVEQKKEEVLAPIREFCAKQLDEEYLQLSIKMIDKLAIKHEFQFMKGKNHVWSAGIIYALGSINFLFDKSFEPCCSLDDIYNFFGTKQTTTGNKYREIKEMLNLKTFDKEFSISNTNHQPFIRQELNENFKIMAKNLMRNIKKIKKQAN